MVLEARDEVGGRSRTINGLVPYDMGSGWIRKFSIIIFIFFFRYQRTHKFTSQSSSLKLFNSPFSHFII